MKASICLEPLQSAGQIDALVQDSLWRWRPVSEGAVWPDSVVVLTPLLDQRLGFLQRVEDLAIEQLVPQLSIEALVVAVLPRTAGLDVVRWSQKIGQGAKMYFTG